MSSPNKTCGQTAPIFRILLILIYGQLHCFLSTPVLCLIPGLICTLVIVGVLFSFPQPVYGVSSQWVWKRLAASVRIFTCTWKAQANKLHSFAK